MHNHLIHLLSNFIDLNEKEKSFIEDNLPVLEFNKGDFLLEQGDVSKSFYFIVSGSVRLYYDVELEEKTAFFYFENEFVSSYESFTQQLPAKHNFQCMESTTVIEISVENVEVMLREFRSFEFLARTIMEQELAMYQNIVSTFILKSPEERYLDLLTNRPEMINRIPQYYLATYIGVRPESLSRIRKRITNPGRS